MGTSFLANALGGTTTTTSFSITLPATAAGDLIILEFTHRGLGNGTIGGTYTGPAFTLKHDQVYAASTFSGKTYWSRATGNHSGETVTGSSLSGSCAAIITIYRGALASGDPLADATVVGEANASGNETQAGISNATPGAQIVLVVANCPDQSVTAQACTSPGALAARAEVLSTGGLDSAIAHASAQKLTAGGTGSFTWAQTDQASGSWAYAIKPEPFTKSVSLDAAAQQSRSAVSSLDLAVRRALSQSASMDATVAAHASASVALDSAIAAARSAAASLDSAIRQARSASTGQDAVVVNRFSAQASLDAALALASSLSGSLDAAVQAQRSASSSLDAAVRISRSASAAQDAVVQAERAATASFDAQIELEAAAGTRVVSLDAAIERAAAAQAALDAAIQISRSAAIGLDVAVLLARTAVVDQDAAVRYGRSAVASMDLIMQRGEAILISLDSLISGGVFAKFPQLDAVVVVLDEREKVQFERDLAADALDFDLPGKISDPNLDF